MCYHQINSFKKYKIDVIKILNLNIINYMYNNKLNKKRRL